METIQNAAGQPAGAGTARANFYDEVAKLGVLSPIAAFLRYRRNARMSHMNLTVLYDVQRRVQRSRKFLEGSPFNARRLSEIDASLAKLAVLRDEVMETQRSIGRALIDLAPWIDETTTLEQRLELLNCNPADRGRIDEPDLGLVMLMAAYCVEDSAFHRNDQWNDRPLHAAVNAEMHRVMFYTPEGRAASDKMFDELFAPGGMFETVPRAFLQPDGSMLRQAPSLTVHDAAGSRVIERTPS